VLPKTGLAPEVAAHLASKQKDATILESYVFLRSATPGVNPRVVLQSLSPLSCLISKEQGVPFKELNNIAHPFKSVKT